MELRQLEYLVAVVDEGGFTRAAERLRVAQPGVSAQVRRLEAELGQPLLDRGGGSVTPTHVGAAVLPYARAALSAVAGVRAAVDELTGLLRGHVAVGTVPGGGRYDVPALLAAFHAAHPAVEITLAEAPSDVLLERVRDGALDFALLGAAPGAEHPGVHTRVLAREPLVAAVAQGAPLAARRSITLAALAEHALTCTPAGSGLRAALEEACRAAGVRPRVALEAGGQIGKAAGRGRGEDTGAGGMIKNENSKDSSGNE